MSFLRTVSSRRLLALVAGVLAVAVAGTAIALAASGGGPVPPRKRLAVAVHDALSAPKVQGVSARIKFTNHLIDSAELQGGDPILTGATGRLWASADHRLRIELQSEQGDVQAVADGKRFWVYDGSSNTVYRGRIPQGRRRARSERADRVPSVARIQRQIARVLDDATLSGAVPGNVAGRPSYRVSISPKRDAGLLSSAQLAWDAAYGVPLRAAVYARGSSSPALELEATDISFGRVPASAFVVSPPAHATHVNLSSGSSGEHNRDAGAQALPFKLSAPG